MLTKAMEQPVDGATSVLDTEELREKVGALESGAAYPDHPAAVESIETHFAWVFLAGDYAYKLRKPMRNPLTDLTTLAARQASCDQDLRLNRRLARDVYLDVVPLARVTDGSLRVQGDGAIVEWLTRMRRLPSALMLDRAIACGTASTDALTAVGATLALRTLDPAEELAFLCLECRRAGGDAAGIKILESYRRESFDPVTVRLIDFYRSRRALVRAKIMAWHLCDSSVANLAPWREQAEEYLGLAQRYALQAVR